MNKNLLAKLAVSYKSTYLPSPAPGKCTISEWELFVASERLPDLCLISYAKLVLVELLVSQEACQNIFDGVKYAHILNDCLTDTIITVNFELAWYPPRYHISWCHHEDCQKTVVWFP